MNSTPVWWDLFSGVPLQIQAVFWLIVFLTTVSFLALIALLVAAARSRSRRSRKHVDGDMSEDDLLWVFLVPALNEEITIADSVRRLAATHVTHSIIIAIDDASQDRTPEILAHLDVAGLRVLRRELPNAQMGKAAALNAAFGYLTSHVLREPEFSHWNPDQIVVGIIDADGRLDPHAPQALAWHFAAPDLGGVQTLVRIYNRRGWLTWAQDVEYSSFAFVYQAGRSLWGTANMGGNGQFNRMSALASVSNDEGPWRDRLTEDQDLGIRLIQAGWRGAQENGTSMHQQGLSSLPQLYRQRTRWAQGAWQALSLLPGVGRTRSSFWGKVDAVLYLLTPVLQTIVGIALLITIVLAFIFSVSVIPRSLLYLLIFLTIGLAPILFALLFRGRGWIDVWQAVVLLVPYAIYSWLIFPVVITSLIRELAGRTSWAKTAREPLNYGDDESAGLRATPDSR